MNVEFNDEHKYKDFQSNQVFFKPKTSAIILWLINKRLAKDERQATTILQIITFTFIIITLIISYVNFVGFRKSRPKDLDKYIDKVRHITR